MSVGRWMSGLSTGCALAVGMVSAAAAAEALEYVTVTAERATTATKTDTALIETPQAISVVTAGQFLDRGALTMQETLRYSAGVTSEAYGLDTRSDQPAVRGFYTVQYLDAMTKLFGYSLIPRAEVYTLERIELLRGPSSALYGKGNTGGVTNMVSKRPLFENQGEVGLQFGSYDRKQAQFDLTGPLGDAFAGRVIGILRDSDMQTNGIPDDRSVLAPSLTWHAGDRTSVTLLALFQEDETASSQQFLPVAATLLAPRGRRLADATFLGEPDFDRLDSKQSAGTLLMAHEFSDALKLNVNLRYVDASSEFNEIYSDVYSDPANPFIDAARRVVNRSAYSIRSRTNFFTNDNNLQFDFATGAFTHKLLGGIDYQNFRESSESGSYWGPDMPIDIYAPVYGTYITPELGPTLTQRQQQFGLYLQDQIRYAERTNLVLGVRRDRAGSAVDGADEQIDYATTFRAGLIVDAGAGVSPYVSYSESFLPLVGLDFYGRPYVPQRGRQWEGGIKWQPRAGTMITLAGFDIVEENRQTNDPDNVLNSIQTGEVSSKGVELEASHGLSDDFNLTAAYSYVDAKVTSSTFAPEVGVQLSDVPQEQASLWGVKTVQFNNDLSLRLGAGVRYVGSTLSTSASGSLATPSYTLADALVSLDSQSWAASVSATNVFDKSYYSPCRAFGDCFTGNRRSMIGTLTYRF